MNILAGLITLITFASIPFVPVVLIVLTKERVLQWLFQIDGRVSRNQYWKYNVIATVLLSALWGCAIVLDVSGSSLMYLFYLMAIVVAILLIITSGCVAVRRIHDCGYSGCWLFLFYGLILFGLIAVWGEYDSCEKANRLVNGCFDAYAIGNRSLLQYSTDLVSTRKFYTYAQYACLVGLIVFTITLCLHDGTAGSNRFGKDHKNRNIKDDTFAREKALDSLKVMHDNGLLTDAEYKMKVAMLGERV